MQKLKNMCTSCAELSSLLNTILELACSLTITNEDLQPSLDGLGRKKREELRRCLASLTLNDWSCFVVVLVVILAACVRTLEDQLDKVQVALEEEREEK